MAVDPLRVVPLSQRLGSSHSTYSTRSISRASQRPISRLSQRTIAKQPHLVALLNTLVKQVTGLNEKYDAEDIQDAIDITSKKIDQTKQATVPDLAQIDAHFRGHIKKARINSQGVLADALHTKYAELKLNVAERRDMNIEIKPSTLPNHLQLLLLLSSPPVTATLSHAETILQKNNDSVPRSPVLTWREILEEEPFEGQHWQGAYGLPEGSTVEHWEEESGASDASSLLDALHSEEDAASFSEDEYPSPPKARVSLSEPYLQTSNSISGREIIEALQKKQYWRSGWQTEVNVRLSFDIGDAWTLGPALDHILMNNTAIFTGLEQTFINEVDVVREVLMVLQGRRSCLFGLRSYQGHLEVTVLHYRRIVHLTRASQASILASFASRASILNPLRDFVDMKLGKSTSSSPERRCRTLEAFMAAVGRQLLLFDEWCVEQEERISLAQRGGCSSNHVVSLLSLDKEVCVKLAGTFKVLLEISRLLQSKEDRLSPSMISTLILNALLDAARTLSAIGDTTTARCLMVVWEESAEPLWANVGRWLKDGIPIRTGFEGGNYEAESTWDDKEFFIRMNPLVGLESPDFWESGYTLLTCQSHSNAGPSGGEVEVEEYGIPSFLQPVAEDILAAGKAIGLLRALDMVYLVGDDWLKGWSEVKALTEACSPRGSDEALENLMSDILLPPCRLAQSWLRQMLIEECDLWKHLKGLENVCLMTRGDAMSQFGEKLFARMDAHQPWNDFHFLNIAFRDVSKAGATSWINASLVRIVHRGNKDRSISRTVRAIDGLYIEYAVPFPLTYVFAPETNASYSSLFCFLLQIRRSKGVLDRILIRGLNRGVLDYETPDLRAFYALRSKLSWFVNTLMTFILTNVIHAGLLEFHEVLRKADSLDEMIFAHRAHLEKLLGRCLLQPNTSALHRAILSILDLSLHFSDFLYAFAGDTSLDVSRRSLVAIRRRHRRGGRGVRTRKADVIGFTEALPPSEDDSESESSDEDAAAAEPSFYVGGGGSISVAEESFSTRLDKMSLELDGLVRFVRRGVESLAGGGGEAGPAFGVFAFCLEDWDR